MRIENEPAYVLHRRAFGETSVTLELLTKNYGRVGALARGARQRNPKGGKDALALGALYLADLGGSGELMQMRRFEICETAPNFNGERSLALMYINELIIALLARGDAHERLFLHYQNSIQSIAFGELGANLRAFERMLLEELGYGIDFDNDVTGAAIAHDAWYRLDPNAGFVATQAGATAAISGVAILEFDSCRFSKTHNSTTRGIMRLLISERLSGKTLKSWDMLRDLASLRS